ncbi:MAG: hypothetical protein IGS48_18565 [Oscillatoriales cyanobacterium C42_A2020_001]|nr:hypothetical protein [Leptolyngbyaceae cyanobacterium C42_A2020_001]
MIFNTGVAYSLLLSVTTIALTQASTIAHPSWSQLRPLQHSHSTRSQPTLIPQPILAGKPGLPRRRVGGGSRLY